MRVDTGAGNRALVVGAAGTVRAWAPARVHLPVVAGVVALLHGVLALSLQAMGASSPAGRGPLASPRVAWMSLQFASAQAPRRLPAEPPAPAPALRLAATAYPDSPAWKIAPPPAAGAPAPQAHWGLPVGQAMPVAYAAGPPPVQSVARIAYLRQALGDVARQLADDSVRRCGGARRGPAECDPADAATLRLQEQYALLAREAQFLGLTAPGVNHQ